MTERRVARVCMLTALLLGSCRGSGRTPPPAEGAVGSPTTQATAAPEAAESAGNRRPSIDIVVALVCDDGATKLETSAQPWSGESWECTKQGERLRIDFYLNDTEQRKAQQALLDSYRAKGDARPLSELPVLCGSRFAIGSDTVDIRDALIEDLAGARVAASTC